ncbi:aldo-keto reductase-like protein [Thermochaetoides thermophila DSM 1495]|uniref:Aldo-keto reductase-like protein n=1 Tax=Chaetomium thermophilum (strain DSM 1495 / CBS 144.50 / IMI 039719) TaxID=759272 RepID=G0SFU1_CHATD|nr:aldo-keto reductase-like protein [Thermochaetoides thermophila DSM 1495]EGS17856.1 aldo-keto reductase-like protein [Thermochaetoides thermophila DSM 1495]
MAQPSIPTRQLGRDGPTIPILGLGLMGLSSFYGTPPPEEERLQFLDRAHELGCRHWDTAALSDGGREFRNDPEFIRQAVKDALSRLKTDYIDLLYCHRISGKTPIEDIVSTMKEFVVYHPPPKEHLPRTLALTPLKLSSSGQVRYLGLSECGADTLRRAVRIHPIHAYQAEYSPFTRDIEHPSLNLLSTCRELGIGIVAYCPLGRGMLTGKYTSLEQFEAGDFRKAVPRFMGENFERNMELVRALGKVAARKGCTTGQLVLGWLMRQEGVFPIPGTKRVQYLEENWGANAVYGGLTEEEVRELRELIEGMQVWGERYPVAMMGGLLKDTPPKE